MARKAVASPLEIPEVTPEFGQTHCTVSPQVLEASRFHARNLPRGQQVHDHVARGHFGDRRSIAHPECLDFVVHPEHSRSTAVG